MYSLQEEAELAGKYLEYSLQAGYNNLDQINKDSDLAELRDTHYFKKAVSSSDHYASGSLKLSKETFGTLFALVNMILKCLD